MSNLKLVWSQAKHLDDLEVRLIKLFSAIPYIKDLRKAARRFTYMAEVQFKLEGSASIFYFLYDNGWLLGKAEDSRGLPDPNVVLPQRVIDYINKRFLSAQYTLIDNPSYGSSYVWNGIAEEQLPSID